MVGYEDANGGIRLVEILLGMTQGTLDEYGPEHELSVCGKGEDAVRGNSRASNLEPETGEVQTAGVGSDSRLAFRPPIYEEPASSATRGILCACKGNATTCGTRLTRG